MPSTPIFRSSAAAVWLIGAPSSPSPLRMRPRVTVTRSLCYPQRMARSPRPTLPPRLSARSTHSRSRVAPGSRTGQGTGNRTVSDPGPRTTPHSASRLSFHPNNPRRVREAAAEDEERRLIDARLSEMSDIVQINRALDSTGTGVLSPTASASPERRKDAYLRLREKDRKRECREIMKLRTVGLSNRECADVLRSEEKVVVHR